MFFAGYIYTLSNPVSGNIFYVGKTIQPGVRQRVHKLRTHNENVNRYITASNINPVFEILESVYSLDKFSSKYVIGYIEDYWIDQFKALGFDLINKMRMTKDAYESYKLNYQRYYKVN